MYIDQDYANAAKVFGPMAEAIINSDGFDTLEKYEPVHALVWEDIRAAYHHLAALDNRYQMLATSDFSDVRLVFTMMMTLREKAYGRITPVASSLSGPAFVSTLPPPVIVQGSVTAPVPLGDMVPKPDPNGTNSCFVRGCGLKFTTFQDAIAHKCLIHGYNQGRWTIGWARDYMKTRQGVVMSTTPFSDPSIPDPNKITVTDDWKPIMDLDLRGLGMATGEASRFAVGTKADARFYFIRLLRKDSTIKGRFVWTKFRGQYNQEYLHSGDFVVRKEAGDTKEWIGLQSPKGVQRPKPGGQRWEREWKHQDVYVGDHEADIAEILKNPHEARVKYGLLIGACGYCGRKLTDPDSRARGIGPDCWEAHSCWMMPTITRRVLLP